MAKIPVQGRFGYLGSGKTTLLIIVYKYEKMRRHCTQ